MSRLDQIAARTEASRSASGTNFRVVGITVDGGYSVEATDLFEGGVDVATHGYLPEETAELFAQAPADLSALVEFARQVKASVTSSWRALDPNFDVIRDLLNDLEAS